MGEGRRPLGLAAQVERLQGMGAFGEDAYPTVALKAAALLHSLARNHALVDGNKRLAWLATVVFLDLNSYKPDLSDDAAFELVTDAAEGAVDVEQIASRLSLIPHARET
ncbi:MAG: Fic family protein [Nocardioidaceae bacterium]